MTGSRRANATTTLVVAAAGYGKSTWADGVPGAHVLDDLHLVPSTEQPALLLDVRGDLEPGTPLVVTSRVPLEAKVRARLSGPVRERGPRDLALSPHQVAAVLEEEYGLTDPELPSRVHGWTAGWPTLVHLAADAATAGSADDLLDRLTLPDGPVASWLENDVLAALPDEASALAARMAPLAVVTPALAGLLGGPSDTDRVLRAYAALVRVGVLVPHWRHELLGREEHRVPPLVAAALRPEAGGGLSRDAWSTAAQWYADHDAPFAAAQALLSAGLVDEAVSLVGSSGDRMVAQGDAAGVVALVESNTDVTDLTAAVRRSYALALDTGGDTFAALTALGPLIAVAEREGWSPSLAIQVADVRNSQGDYPEALRVLDRVDEADLADDAVGVGWRARRVNVCSLLGQEGDLATAAEAVLHLAEAVGDPGGVALAHRAVAKTSHGSRKDVHLEQALTSFRRAGDACSLAPILVNRTFSLLASGRFEEAVLAGREAVRVSELVRPKGSLIMALHNLAEALTRTGEFAEARWHLRRAAACCQRLAPHRAASSCHGLGELHRVLGQREQGRAAYREAIALAREARESQVLVPALAGLARLLAADEPEAAGAAAEEASSLASSGLRAFALIACAEVALASGDREAAATHAADAAEAAREDHALDLVADALELAARAETDPARAEAFLLQAHSLWLDGGAGPDADRVQVLLGRLEGADREAQRRGRDAAQRLQRLGVARVGGRSTTDDPVGREVRIHLLARFEVCVAGEPISLKTWKSRQARTLVKVLAARRGRPVSRGELCELLWPDDDPVKTSHRLSVLLTTVRGVLDPGKAWPPDRYVATDARGVWLDLRRVDLDLEEVLAEAEHGAALLGEGDLEAARVVLDAVDRRYRGELFEDEPYEDWLATDWAAALQEESRAAWLRSVRHLATIATKQGRHNDASSLLVRLLGVDPYDERVHRGLVRTLVRVGRHGEARRAFERWSAAMDAVDAPAPDSAVLIPR